MASIGTVWTFLLMLLIVADVIGRSFLSLPITGVAEVAGQSVVAIVFLQLGAAVFLVARDNDLLQQQLADYQQQGCIVAGLAKTRLIPVLGRAGAARAQRRFMLNTLQIASAAALGPLTLWCAPDATHRFFRALHRITGTACFNQPQGDIGARMLHACVHHFAHHADLPLLLLGTDCPALAPGHLQQAAQALTQHDVVLIPAEDGGYVLIGMRVLVPQVFEGIAWSMPQVMAQTRDQLRRTGVSWFEMPTLWDVDEPADWQRLQTLFELPHLKTQPRPLRAPT